MEYIDSLVDTFIRTGSSDLHLATNKIPRVRLNSSVVEMKGFSRVITEQDIETFMLTRQSHKLEDWEKFKRKKIHSLDSSLTFLNRRFRLHFYHSSSGMVLVFRILKEEIPTSESLNLPNEVMQLTKFSKGLILVTGATGSGKSTTLASLIDAINHERSKIIVTVEDPIEYVYTDDKSRIEQREVGLHVNSFEEATRDMMREDPDIILVGEMRDVSTIRNAITLSETGHLVLSTLHTKSVIDSIDRMIDVFPAEQQQQIRIQLSYVLIGILNQTLISSEGTEQTIPLCELLMNDSVTSSMIRQTKGGNNLKDYIRSSKNGSLHIIDNAAWHIENGRLTMNDCESVMDKPDLEVLKTILSQGTREQEPFIGSSRKQGIGYGKRRF